MPRKKEGRAARLAALERDANGSSIASTMPEGEATTPDSVAGESRADEGESSLGGQLDEGVDEVKGKNRADEGGLKPDGEVTGEIQDEEEPVKQVAEASA